MKKVIVPAMLLTMFATPAVKAQNVVPATQKATVSPQSAANATTVQAAAVAPKPANAVSQPATAPQAVAGTVKSAPVATQQAATPQTEEKTKLDPANLPDAVKSTLATEQYKSWQPTSAWQLKAEPLFYVIELKKGDQTTLLKVDKDGKVK